MTLNIATILVDNSDVNKADLRAYLAGRDFANIRDEGAACDGVTDTKTLIDSLNTAGACVNLSNADHAYTGTFVPSAHFVNGRIISSVGGTFDYRSPLVMGAKTVTVGTGGTFKTLKAALDWAQGVRIGGTLTISILNHNDLFTNSGVMSLNAYTFAHPDAKNVFITGPALAGTFPALGDMVGTQATDEATIKARFSASIYLNGSGTYGLRLPNGIGGIEKLYIKSDARYTLDFGFNGSHSNKSGAIGGTLGSCAISGGTWGVVGAGATLSQSGKMLYTYQSDGGAFDMTAHSVYDAQNYTIQVYQPNETQYGIFLEMGSVFYGDNNLSVKGRQVHAVYATDHSVVKCAAAAFTNCGHAITAARGSLVAAAGAVLTDLDSTAVTLSISQPIYGGNAGAQNLVFCGADCVVEVNAMSFVNCKGVRGIGCYHGTIVGYDAVTMDGCDFPNASSGHACYFFASVDSYLKITLTNPDAGSSVLFTLVAGSWVRKVSTSSGVTNNTETGSTLLSV